MGSLKHIEGRVIVSVDLEAKNWHSFEDGTKIRLERQFNELNRRLTEPVNAIVISAENIPQGSEILVHPNAPTETNKIHNYLPFSGDALESNIQYFSIPEDQCFAYFNESGEWQTLPPYETALRVFKPYQGFLTGIDPTQYSETLFVTSGRLSGQVVKTVKAADYEVVFQDKNGREGRLIRFRPDGDPKTKREEEAVAILNVETELVNKGELFVGLSTKDAKPLKESVPIH